MADVGRDGKQTILYLKDFMPYITYKNMAHYNLNLNNNSNLEVIYLKRKKIKEGQSLWTFLVAVIYN